MFNAKKIFKYFQYMSLSALFVMATLSPNKVYAQTCGDVFTDEDIIKYFDRNTCPSEREIYKMAAIVGERAIPGLRKLGESGQCGDGYEAMRVYTPLARLGDQEAFKELEKRLYERTRFNRAFDNLAFVRNNQAVSILMTYFSKYRSDPSMNIDIFAYDHLATLIHKMGTIAFARKAPQIGMPELPFVVIGNAQRDEWEAWWNTQKDIPFSSSDHSDISDPQLRCLAGMIEWGLPEAAMLMTELPGMEKEAESVLKTFQRDSDELFGSISGTIDVALLRFGDEVIMTELNNRLGSKTTYMRNSAIKKMRIANTKESIDILLNALDVKKIDGVGENGINIFRGEILNALSQMIENPPLDPEADPTPENIQKWKQWWSENKDTAVLKRQSANDMEWRHDMGR